MTPRGLAQRRHVLFTMLTTLGYHYPRIVAEDDLRDALERLQASLTAGPPGIVTPLREAAERAGR